MNLKNANRGLRLATRMYFCEGRDVILLPAADRNQKRLPHRGPTLAVTSDQSPKMIDWKRFDGFVDEFLANFQKIKADSFICSTRFLETCIKSRLLFQICRYLWNSWGNRQDIRRKLKEVSERLKKYDFCRILEIVLERLCRAWEMLQNNSWLAKFRFDMFWYSRERAAWCLFLIILAILLWFLCDLDRFRWIT